MGFVLVFALVIWTVPFAVCLFPDDQPGCIFRPEANFFYAYNAHLQPNPKNWLCDEETFEERLKICIDIYEKTTQGKVETSYEIVRDKESVSKVCEKRKMTFTQEFESGEPEFDKENITVRNTTIEVNMFACPITKMDLRYPIDYLKPELFDIYISLGRNDVTIAALTDSSESDNICIRNVYLYPPKELRNQTSRSRPFYPDEVRNYKYMDDEYFQNLYRKLYSRKMATATGSAFDYWSTVLHNFTNPETPETSTSVNGSSSNAYDEYADFEFTTPYDGRESSEETSTDDGDEETNASSTTDDSESSEEDASTTTDEGESSEETSTDDEDEETKSSSGSNSVEEGDDVSEMSTTLDHTVIPATKSASELPSTEATPEVTKATKKAVSRKARVTKSKASSKKARLTKSKKSTKKARVTKAKAASKKARVTKPKTGSKKATKKRVTRKKVSSKTPPAVS